MVSFNFKDKVAFVTGSATGIGQATAKMFSQAGCRVAIVDSNSDFGQMTTKSISQDGGVAEFFECDVSKPEDVRLAIEQTVKTFGRLDFAFNNAGIEGDPKPIADGSLENWQRTIDVNLKGVWLCMKYQIPQMLKQGGGSIVNCASIAGLVGFENIAPYVASKHGVIGLTRTAALELAQSNIRVNVVCPGVIQTPMIDRFVKGNEQAKLQLAAGEPMGRMGTPEEIAQAVLWLCSSGASFITGHPMVVDGGWVAR